MLNEVIFYAFLLLQVATGVAIVVRFRGSPGAVLGGIAFGVWVVGSITKRVLGALDVEWWRYDLAFTLSALAAWGCLLAALLTVRVHNVASEVSDEVVETNNNPNGGDVLKPGPHSHRWPQKRKEQHMKKFAFITPMFVLGFLTYWGFAWFCTDWDISNAPIRTLVGIIDAIGEPAFCNLAIIGSIGFPIYIVLYFTIIRKKLKKDA